MRTSLLIFILFVSKTVYGNCLYDTIANWQIYYGTKLLTSGNENQYRVPETGSLILSKEKEKLEIYNRIKKLKFRERKKFEKWNSETCKIIYLPKLLHNIKYRKTIK